MKCIRINEFVSTKWLKNSDILKLNTDTTEVVALPADIIGGRPPPSCRSEGGGGGGALSC